MRETGQCKLGDKCRFAHITPAQRAHAGVTARSTIPVARSSAPAPPTASVSDGVGQFWSRLTRTVESGHADVSKLQLHEAHNRQHWLACWAAAAAGVRSGSSEALIHVLLSAVAKANIVPPALDIVRVLRRVVDASQRGGQGQGRGQGQGQGRGAMASLCNLERVADVVCNRLVGHVAEVSDPDALIRALVEELNGPFTRAVSDAQAQLSTCGDGMSGVMRANHLLQRYLAGSAACESELRRACAERTSTLVAANDDAASDAAGPVRAWSERGRQPCDRSRRRDNRLCLLWLPARMLHVRRSLHRK